MKKLLQFLLFLGLGALILFLVYRNQKSAYEEECCLKNMPELKEVKSMKERAALLETCHEQKIHERCPSLMEKLVTDFKNANFGWLGLVLLVFIISNISRTIKWQLLLRPLGYRTRFINGFLSILTGYFANLGLPRMGEVVRAGIFSKYERLPVEKVMGTIVVDRIVDVLCLALTFGLALIFEFDKLWNYKPPVNQMEDEGNNSWVWKGAIVTVLVLAILLFLFRNKLATKLSHLFHGFWEGIQTVRRLEKPGLFVFHSLNIFFCYFLMTWFGFKAFVPTADLDLRAALTVFAFGTLGMVIPSPGGMGTFHFLVIQSLTLFYGILEADAFSAANIVFFTVSIGFNMLLGLTSLILLPVLNRKYAGSTPA